MRERLPTRSGSFLIGAFLSVAVTGAQECPVLISRGRLAYESRSFELAAKEFAGAVTACAEKLQPLLYLAQSWTMLGQLPEALNALENLLALDSGNKTGLKLQGDVLYLLGREPEAEKSLLAAINADPQFSDAIYALGRIYYQQSRYAAAVEQFQKVLRLDPKSYRAWDNLGLAYEALNEFDKATQHYLKALDLVHKDHPEYDWAYANLANLLMKKGDYRQAFNLAAEAAERNPNSARNYYLTAKALVSLERMETSVRWLKRSIELDSNYAEPRYLLAQVYRKLGQREEAERQLKAFREINARTPRNRR
ncbi:MAG: tetratricopeptide repeat protein [Bryobacteraceae bacterium]